MSKPRIRLGELLVNAQIIRTDQLEAVLELQKTDGRRLGTLLVEKGLVSETQVTQILSQQLSIPWVSLYHTDFSRQLLNHVPQSLAEKHCLIPIFVRRIRGYGDTLYLAMDDPSDEVAKKEIEAYSGLPVRAMIAPPSDILAAIAAYYGPSEPPESMRSAPPGATSSSPPTRRISSNAPAPASSGPPTRRITSHPPEAAAAASEADSEPPESGPVIEAHEVSMPPPKRRPSTRMVTVTLLDGTQVNLPAAGGKKKEQPTSADEGLTARDMVAALRAVSHGADASEILGDDVNWQAMFAALLSLLLKKHLIADWEFVEEFKKI